ncbi:hypothetical protein HID58_051532, partial [Brassica napus]
MGEEHEGDSVIRVITTVACPCQPMELSPVYLQRTAVSEALPIEIPVTDLRMVERWRFLDLLQRRLFCLARIRLAIDAMAKNSLRCVAIACRTQELNKVPKEQEDLDKWSLLEDELTLLAIVGRSHQDPRGSPMDPLLHGSKNGIGRGRREAPLKCHRTPTTLSVSSDAEGGVGGSRPDCPEWLHLMRSRKFGRERGAH